MSFPQPAMLTDMKLYGGRHENIIEKSSKLVIDNYQEDLENDRVFSSTINENSNEKTIFQFPSTNFSEVLNDQCLNTNFETGNIYNALNSDSLQRNSIYPVTMNNNKIKDDMRYITNIKKTSSEQIPAYENCNEDCGDVKIETNKNNKSKSYIKSNKLDEFNNYTYDTYRSLNSLKNDQPEATSQCSRFIIKRKPKGSNNLSLRSNVSLSSMRMSEENATNFLNPFNSSTSSSPPGTIKNPSNKRFAVIQMNDSNSSDIPTDIHMKNNIEFNDSVTNISLNHANECKNNPYNTSNNIVKENEINNNSIYSSGDIVEKNYEFSNYKLTNNYQSISTTFPKIYLNGNLENPYSLPDDDINIDNNSNTNIIKSDKKIHSIETIHGNNNYKTSKASDTLDKFPEYKIKTLNSLEDVGKISFESSRSLCKDNLEGKKEKLIAKESPASEKTVISEAFAFLDELE